VKGGVLMRKEGVIIQKEGVIMRKEGVIMQQKAIIRFKKRHNAKEGYNNYGECKQILYFVKYLRNNNSLCKTVPLTPIYNKEEL
jgi:hypothetical protein